MILLVVFLISLTNTKSGGGEQFLHNYVFVHTNITILILTIIRTSILYIYTKSGGGEQFLLLACRMGVRVKGLFFSHRHTCVCKYVCVYIYVYIYIYIYIYIHTYIHRYSRWTTHLTLEASCAPGVCKIRPVHLLIIILLRVLESNFPGDSL